MPAQALCYPVNLILLLSLCAGSLGACSANAPERPVMLTVFAAASLSAAFQELGHGFEALHPGMEIVFNFAGSQQLVQQLREGAPADVFASANLDQMQAAESVGRVSAQQAEIFATNQLTVVYPPLNPAGLKSLADLGRPGLRLVLAAVEVPAGAYTQEFLQKASQDPAFGPDFLTHVLGNVVSYEDNVRAVLSKVVLGEADAGIVYLSDLSSAGSTQPGHLEIPPALNLTASYPIAPVRDAANPDLAAAFVAYVLSPAGQATLARFGLTPATAIP